jgi:hypothetical protein
MCNEIFFAPLIVELTLQDQTIIGIHVSLGGFKKNKQFFLHFLY